jgi:hypothetical protein
MPLVPEVEPVGRPEGDLIPLPVHHLTSYSGNHGHHPKVEPVGGREGGSSPYQSKFHENLLKPSKFEKEEKRATIFRLHYAPDDVLHLALPNYSLRSNIVVVLAIN